MNNATTNKENTKNYNQVYNYTSLLLIIAGLTLFYALNINIWLKWGVVLISVVASFGLFFFVSETGLNLHDYLRDVWRELGKIVWPARKEAMQFTWIVFLFVIILALFLWLVDSVISWTLYSLILGKS